MKSSQKSSKSQEVNHEVDKDVIYVQSDAPIAKGLILSLTHCDNVVSMCGLNLCKFTKMDVRVNSYYCTNILSWN